MGCRLLVDLTSLLNYDFIGIKCDNLFQRDVRGRWMGSQKASEITLRELMARKRDEESVSIAHNFLALMSALMVTLFISGGWGRTTDWESTSFREEN